MPSKKAKSSGKKSAAKKPKSTAKVELDPDVVHKFESSLRDGLVASGAVMSSDNKEATKTGYANVKLDAPTVARLSEVLRKGLVSSQVVMANDNLDLNKMTGKVKGKKRSSKKAR